MAQSVNKRPRNKTYLGNNNPSKMEVHNLNKETDNCQVDEIISNGNAVVFKPDTKRQAKKEGFDPCYYCMSGSTR